MDLYGIYAISIALLSALGAWSVWRGARLEKRCSPSGRIYRYSRAQQLISSGVGLPLIVFVATVPYHLSPFTGLADVAVLLVLLTGCSIIVLEAKNRLVIVSSEGLVSSARYVRNPPLPWADINRVSFYDTFGGFFIVHHSTGRLYIPVQVNRPLELLKDLEGHVPAAAMVSAKKGIAICRAHLS